MRKLIALLASGVVAASVFGITPSANADTTPPPSCSTADTTSAQGNCIESHTAQATSKTTDKAYAAVGTSGKVLVRYNIASGIRTTTAENGTGCKLYKSASARPASATCVRLATGATYINSGVRVGQSTWTKWRDSVRAPWCKFVKRGTQWYKAGCYSTTTRTITGNCGNAVWFAGPQPALTYNQVILVQSFEQWNFSGSVAVQSTATSTATARAWCNQNGSSASATGNGSGTGTGQASASYTLKGLSKIQAWLNGKEVSFTSSTSLDAQAQATASSESSAVSSASAQVTCSSAPQSSPPPPQQTPPSIVQYTTLNDVDAGATSPNFCATVNIPGSDQGTLTFAATYGSFQTTTFAVNGQVQKCTTYVAPTEVPSGGRDSVTVFVRDNSTGLSDQKSESFPINTPPAPPA